MSNLGSIDVVANLVRTYYSTFVSRNRERMEALMSNEFSFTSPYDDHIDKATFFQKCWPGGDEIRSIHVDKVFHEGGEALVRYNVELKNGETFRNTEFLKIDQGKLKEVEVYFGELPKE